MNRVSNLCVLLGLAVLPSVAWAHPGHSEAGLSAGVAHPLSGLDHLIAMVAVGLWAAWIGGRAVWALPVSFVAAMVLGGALGMTGVVLPGVETGILLSVLVLGLALAAGVKAPLKIAIPLVAAFALFHGHAHGAELPAGVSGTAFMAGFVASTTLLHGVGIGAGVLFTKTKLPLARIAGAAAACCAVMMWLA